MESLGTQLRRQRLRLGLTLDDLAARTGISKPYLSLIETGRTPNPPSDEKLRRLEQTLGFPAGQLVTQAHLHRTPEDVRAVLQSLIARGMAGGKAEKGEKGGKVAKVGGTLPKAKGGGKAKSASDGKPINLDEAYLSGVLQDLVEKSAGNIQPIRTNSVPVINCVSAGYPKDFTDLSYPRGVADEYVGCPDLSDPDAFAARVSGDSMAPKYGEGDIVIFSPALPPRSGDDCFVRFEDGSTTFKRAFFETSKDGKSVIRLQPRNERYAPQVVDREQVAGLYKAIFRYQRVDND